MTDNREVPVAWDALEDAFENNASEVHSFLHLETGDVTRIVDGVVEPGVRARASRDPLLLRINAVSSREQYRWMERFIETVEEPILSDLLAQAIDGKGAFRRFKDVLITHPVDRERWFVFRSERLRACMEAWLLAHDLVSVARPDWPVPSVEEVRPRPRARPKTVDRRVHLRSLVDSLPGGALANAEAFLEFLIARGFSNTSQPAASAPTSELAENGVVDDAVDSLPGDAVDDGVDTVDGPINADEKSPAESVSTPVKEIPAS